MDDETINTAAEDKTESVSPPKPKKKRGFIKKTVIILFFLAIILGILIQTSFFRNWILHIALDKVNGMLADKESVLSVESIEGTFVRDLRLNRVNLVVKKDTLLKINSLDLSYDLLSLMNKKVKARSVILDKPEINLTKIKDKQNLDYLLKPEKEKEKDTAKKEFDWKIYVDKLEISGGNFRSLAEKDENVPVRAVTMKKIKSLEFDNLDVIDLNLSLFGSYLPDEKSVNILNLSFRTNSDFNINNLSLEAKLDKDDLAQVQHMRVLTDKSRIFIREASLEHLNPLKEKIDYNDFKKKNFVIDIVTNKFNFDDLTFFLPDIKFMDGLVYLKLSAKGNYSDFRMDELKVNLPYGTSLDINGSVKNLHDPSKLYFDVDCKNAVLNPNDEREIIPGLPIPDYSHLGVITANFKFKGEPLKFNAEAQVKSSAGNADVKGFLDITKNELVYDAKATTENVDIGRIIKNDKFKSSITGDFMVEGRGVDYRTMVNKITYKLTNTSFFGQRIESSSGKINSNSGLIDLDVNYKSNSGYADVKGNVNVKDPNNMGYDLKGLCKGLDISTFTGNKDDAGSLNFTFDVKGTGTDPDKLLGKMNFNFDRSMLAGYVIPATPLTAEFRIDSARRVVTLTSDFLDLDAQGRFKMLDIPALLSANITKITQQIENNLKNDTMGFKREATVLDRRALFSSAASFETDFRYNIKIKNLVPLYLLMKDSSLVFKCDIRGRILNDKNSFVFTTQGRFEDFKYKDSVFGFKNSIVRVFLKDDAGSNLPFTYLTDFNTRFSKINFGTAKFDTLNVDMNTNAETPVIRIFAKKDSVKGLYANGILSLASDNYGLRLDTLKFFYDKYDFSNSEPVSFRYVVNDTGSAGNNIRVNSFKLDDGSQRISAEGYYSLNGKSDIQISADKINIAKFQMFSNPRIDKDNLIKGNVRRIKLHFTGSPEDPSLSLETNTDFLSMNRMKLGRIDAEVDYQENVLKPQISFYNPNNAGLLTIDGNVPFKNPISSDISEEEKNSILESNVNLNIAAKDFQIKILEQFVPVISELKGKMNGNIDISGIVKAPILTGGMAVDKGSFTLDMTGVNYVFDANLSTDRQKLNFQKFRIFHKSDPKNVMDMNGYIDFSNLSFNDMELRLRGSAKLLDENVTQNIMGIYGNLYGETGLNDLVLKGNADNLYMTGDLNLTEGRILIVPQYKVAYDIYKDNFVYKVLVDSVSLKTDSLFVVKITDSLSGSDRSRLDPFENYFYRLADTTLDKPKASNFKYYIKVKSLKDIYAKLIIDEKTGQEFAGNVSANITFDNLETESFATRGRVDIGQNAYYKFYKNFTANGYVLFNGDVVNPELFINSNYITNVQDVNNPGASKQVEIDLNVTGNAMNPRLDWKILVNSSPYGGSNPSDDAMSFIVFGKFKDELNADQRLNLLSTVGANVGTSFASNYLSDIINTYLPFILKTDISYKDSQSGSFAENTDVRFTAQIAGATVIFGGQIFRDLSNTNFLIEYPLNNIFGVNNFSQNIILQLERYIDPFNQNNLSSVDNRTGGAIVYRIKF
ncbi:MAG: translocation/assembly module TamB [Bacteroidetes bacterium]|nr:translocation/assembly module TamB [Bacteroidota bacterium]